MTTLRDLTAEFEQTINDELGDEITYTFGAGGAPLTFNTWVEFDTTILNPGHSAASTDAIAVEVPFDKVPDPLADDRITIAVLPGLTWAMKGRNRGPTGSVWVLPLKKVAP